jgi:hypothetical protein
MLELPQTDGDVQQVYKVLPPNAVVLPPNYSGAPSGFTFTGVRGSATLSTWGDAQLIEVTQFYPLILNTALLERIAKDNVRVPGTIPQRVTVSGYVPPDREHTITGWPGGDYTARVAQQQYELGRTVIDFEQAGAPVGLSAEAIEAARERSVAVRSEVLRAGYALKMGQRQ